MLSTRSFFRIRSACFNTWSAGKTSRYLYEDRAGHLRFIGGILEAAYRRLLGLEGEAFLDKTWPRRPSLLPSPYAQAVSKQLETRPARNCKESRDSRSSEPLHPLIPQSPWAISLTSKPVRPSFRY